MGQSPDYCLTIQTSGLPAAESKQLSSTSCQNLLVSNIYTCLTIQARRWTTAGKGAAVIQQLSKSIGSQYLCLFNYSCMHLASSREGAAVIHQLSKYISS